MMTPVFLSKWNNKLFYSIKMYGPYFEKIQNFIFQNIVLWENGLFPCQPLQHYSGHTRHPWKLNLHTNWGLESSHSALGLPILQWPPHPHVLSENRSLHIIGYAHEGLWSSQMNTIHKYFPNATLKSKWYKNYHSIFTSKKFFWRTTHFDIIFSYIPNIFQFYCI